jgi:hypothetical protein
MTWPSAAATAGEDVTCEAASYFPDSLAAGEIEPVDAAVVGADEYAAAGDESTRARVVNVQSGLPHPDYRARRAALNRVTADVAD